MDTVPLCDGCQPVREGDWIRPGSKDTALGGDNRAGCGVVLTAILEILSQGLDYPPLTLLFTVQEEIGLRGAVSEREQTRQAGVVFQLGRA